MLVGQPLLSDPVPQDKWHMWGQQAASQRHGPVADGPSQLSWGTHSLLRHDLIQCNTHSLGCSSISSSPKGLCRVWGPLHRSPCSPQRMLPS